MPNKDGTGPDGEGPKTGRQLGNCKNTKPICGRRQRPGLSGLGKGRGFRRQNPNTE